MFFGCLSVKSVNLGLYVLQGLDSFVTLVNVCCLILPYNFIYSLYISVGSNGNYMGFDEIVCHLGFSRLKTCEKLDSNGFISIFLLPTVSLEIIRDMMLPFDTQSYLHPLMQTGDND